jgi:hypothetical protein
VYVIKNSQKENIARRHRKIFVALVWETIFVDRK